ncbi:MAG TPA: 50S ribosomal protein L7/L12 [Candidatus Pacearchaeota archaeon]|nr:50S ribosomal protein L7/L12 [Candidatus Pacearchaeota archaeon]HOK94407.1 50S ribosomal protein L7/L12 [Candidatus Pacearchaeota archaeon]HPO75480.1 50S ribosomal protein L7/L12 [Candidatus Pacearchaeota archaeon]
MEEEEKIEIPEKFKDLVEKIENLSVSELAQLVKILEKKFGVSAQPTVVAQATVGAAASAQGAVAEEEKTEFDVVLKNPGQSKIAVIKLIKEITGKGLKESKDIADASEKEPQVLKTGVKKEEADELKKKLEEAGATIELK